MYLTFSPALAAVPHIDRFLGGPVAWPPTWSPGPGDVVLGWGRKRSYRWAERYARHHGIACASLEDGFLRSVGFGRGEAPLSLVLDDLGIYYDAGAPSRLEVLIAEAGPDAEQTRRANALTAAWRDGRLSKYNHARDGQEGLPEVYVLVVDQTLGDASVSGGLADAGSFRRMLEAALDEHPEAEILLKVHPEVFAGRKRGYFERLSPGGAGRVRVLGQDSHPAGLIERAAAVYTVTSQMGFEGLLWGRPVRTFGMPFYAGWGLTGDDLAAPARRRQVPLPALVLAALVDYPRYIDPETGERCEVERVMAHLALQRRMRERFPAQVHAVGFGRLRRPAARAYFAGSRLVWQRAGDDLPAGACVARWGRRADESPAQAEPVRLEDGFLRSVGLGAELAQPLSLAMDRVGIYYDSTRPSELERILQATAFDRDLLDRAAHLRRRIVAAGVTKYNVGQGGWTRPEDAGRVILVPGQVENDASIRYGAPGVRGNLELLKAVRAANPDAHVVYKPHPDVLAGLRRAGRAESEAAAHCDAVVTAAAMAELLDQVDEVHVITSLAGFEALLRGKRVVAYGQPFYAGWGLTVDLVPAARRTRRLSLDELVAGVLLLYPTYVSRVTGRFTSAERALEELLAWRAEESVPKPWPVRLARRLGRAVIGVYNRWRDGVAPE
ncbi:MAG: capsular polysaccharide biosynthesis protein [Thiobacillus sp.]|nr:capsular polysaccharide biosynthesis protein [Thiobacillus sp.]